MTFSIQFLGATGRVTGSMYLIQSGEHKVLLECGLIQGGRKEEAHNADPLPFDISEIDAVVLSHAHIDHSGRIPFLVKLGYTGPIYAQRATHALCEIMLPDSGYLNEKDAEWKNKHRKLHTAPLVEALYTRSEAEASLGQFRSIDYDQWFSVVPGLDVRYRDAGHILGSAIVELLHEGHGQPRRIVFSGDLGQQNSPVMDSPSIISNADLVVMESTYGDRQHRADEETIQELGEVFGQAHAHGGNILIPSFAVGRTQDLLYLLSKHHDEWGIDRWKIFLDSPMAIQATNAYAQYRHLYKARLFDIGSSQPVLPNFVATRSTEESMSINSIQSGAIIIAGSGMCTGGRILHHLKNNIWRPECHLVIVGFQARGTLGRRIVDGAETIKLWGDDYAVRSAVHTIGGLSAHADQNGLCSWYGSFSNRPPVYLVHGEPQPQEKLAAQLRERYDAPVHIPKFAQTVNIGS